MTSARPHIIRFPAPLRMVRLAGTALPPLTFSEEEMDAARKSAYEQGAEEATRLLEQQMLELRAEVLHLQEATFAALAGHHSTLTEQFRMMLPEFAMRAVRQVLAATPIEQSTVENVVRELLETIDPAEPCIDIHLSPRDLELIAGQESLFREKHPALSFRPSAELQPGDCVVRTRFGTLDARLSTKLDGVEEVLRAG
jgi:flagellar assembly protein FliH